MNRIVTHDRQEWMEAMVLQGIEPRLAESMYPKLGHLDFILLGDVKVYTLKRWTIGQAIAEPILHPIRAIITKWRGRK